MYVDIVDIDRAIEVLKNCTNETDRQIAKWLEELKAYRTLDKTNYSDGYNKAIDETMIASANAICIGCGYLKGTKCTYTGCNCGVSKPMLETVMKALEQLKAGVSNENNS